MVIKSLNTMEKIVKKNANLMWDGWNVIDLKESNVAKTSPIGIRINDKWYLHKVYKPNRNGWDIPNKYKD
jgi:hypothetical protein